MKKINTLQSLRFFAFLSIFLLHTSAYHYINSFYNPAWGVSFFIILSGFLNGYKRFDNNDHFKFIDIIKYTIHRIKSFYPLHLIMLFLAIPLTDIFKLVSDQNFKEIIIWLKVLIKNVFLLQAYFDNDYFSFNGASWFLSLMIFLIIVTIPLISVVSKSTIPIKVLQNYFFPC